MNAVTLAVELAQVESQIRQTQFRLNCAILTGPQRTTLGVVRAALETRATRLRDLIAWEQELAA